MGILSQEALRSLYSRFLALALHLNGVGLSHLSGTDMVPNGEDGIEDALPCPMACFDFPQSVSLEGDSHQEWAVLAVGLGGSIDLTGMSLQSRL
jgi:hypothetical protein